ncbi:MAG: hypothetical protein ABWK05_03725 [Pyrobaculum sp.]
MSLKISILKSRDDQPAGDVVIDMRDEPQFYDVVILGGRELKSVVATGVVKEGVPIGVGKYTKKPVAAVVNGRVVIKGIPLTLYLEAGVLEKEISTVLNKSRASADELYRKLKEIVVAERRRYKRSHTLTVLSQYLSGGLDSLPPHLQDLVGDVDVEALRKLFDRLVEELY